MKSATLKSIIHGAVVTALTICVTNAMESHNSISIQVKSNAHPMSIQPCIYISGNELHILSITVDLNNNLLTVLPENIGKFRVLERLHLHNNQLITIPNSIGNLGTLTYLALNNNLLTALPDSIGNLVALVDLSLARNKLFTLPDSIGNLVALVELDLTGNPLIGDEQQWGKFLTGAELDDFRYFYKKRDLIKRNKGGLLLIANQLDRKSFFADMPKDLINYIIELHIQDWLGKR